MKSILDRSFKYTDAASTNLRATFARVRRQLKEQEEARATAQAETAGKVKILNRSKS